MLCKMEVLEPRLQLSTVTIMGSGANPANYLKADVYYDGAWIVVNGRESFRRFPNDITKLVFKAGFHKSDADTAGEHTLDINIHENPWVPVVLQGRDRAVNHEVVDTYAKYVDLTLIAGKRSVTEMKSFGHAKYSETKYFAGTESENVIITGGGMHRITGAPNSSLRIVQTVVKSGGTISAPENSSTVFMLQHDSKLRKWKIWGDVKINVI
jgi:hypothetical protein